MKWYKSLSFALLFLVTLANAQSANRFFYELTFKPKKGIDSLQKTVMILDVTDKKSLYRDYLTVSQDSVLKIEVEKMQKAGVFKDLSKMVTMPKFSEKIYKFYPDMKVQYVERISSGFTPMNIGYNDDTKFNWKISNDKQKIGEYEAQKATTEFGGRKWTAWFTESIPFPDGPYKFSGLPGLIVKIEDAEKNFSWVLTANKPLKEFEELSYSEKLSAQFGARNDVTIINRDKFESSFEEYKKDPFASIRAQITPEMKAMKMPGNDKTMGEMMSDQEKSIKDFYNASNNTVEIYTPEKAKK